MNKIWVIYDNEMKIWDGAYKTYNDALNKVSNMIYSMNEDYKNSEEYSKNPTLPGKMQTKVIEDEKLGLFIADVYNYEIMIYIKVLTLS